MVGRAPVDVVEAPGPVAGTSPAAGDALMRAGGAGGGGAPIRPRASSARLVATLALAGAIAGFVLVLVSEWSQPRIEAHRALVLQRAVLEVLDGPASTRTYWLVGGSFTDVPAAGVDTASADRVFVGFDESGAPAGVALAAAEPGFQDVIGLIFGYEPAQGRVLGMKVLESKETPGLGDKIEKDSAFVREFRGVVAPLEGAKESRATGGEREIVMITGATISSRAIIDIINHRLEAVGGPLRELWTGLLATTGAAASGDGTGGGTAPAGGAQPDGGDA
jgi:electron transport complex protein RnfG